MSSNIGPSMWDSAVERMLREEYEKRLEPLIEAEVDRYRKLLHAEATAAAMAVASHVSMTFGETELTIGVRLDAHKLRTRE